MSKKKHVFSSKILVSSIKIEEHPCAINGKCGNDWELIENYDSTPRGRVDAKKCLRCGEVWDIDIVR